VTGEKHPDTVYPVGFFLTTGVVPYEITPALCNCFAPLRGLHMASISPCEILYRLFVSHPSLSFSHRVNRVNLLTPVK